ncbi:hypothetical protein R3P38DRAFT_3173019 [Favolaschia claudopus]|uniref:Uncharacterized protein n=1 Tax=Favolaschia claudopus TaxID=2862362 RepID=A0AAW0DJN6_9AGAR
MTSAKKENVFERASMTEFEGSSVKNPWILDDRGELVLSHANGTGMKTIAGSPPGSPPNVRSSRVLTALRNMDAEQNAAASTSNRAARKTARMLPYGRPPRPVVKSKYPELPPGVPPQAGGDRSPLCSLHQHRSASASPDDTGLVFVRQNPSGAPH